MLRNSGLTDYTVHCRDNSDCREGEVAVGDH